MNILVTNDDGISAKGIKKLVAALHRVANIYVCAPKTQQSATGHGITVNSCFSAEETAFPLAKAAIETGGTPADCVKVGLALFGRRGITFDRIFSGFNHGMNLGAISIYSGTVSAALEGALSGIPSVAMSLCSDIENGETQIPRHYGLIMKLAERLAMPDGTIKTETGPIALPKTSRQRFILNVNVPDIPRNKVKGIKIVPLGFDELRTWFTVSEPENGTVRYSFSNAPETDGDSDSNRSDVVASLNRYATITPILYDRTDRTSFACLRN